MPRELSAKAELPFRQSGARSCSMYGKYITGKKCPRWPVGPTHLRDETGCENCINNIPSRGGFGTSK